MAHHSPVVRPTAVAHHAAAVAPVHGWGSNSPGPQQGSHILPLHIPSFLPFLQNKTGSYSSPAPQSEGFNRCPSVFR